MLRKALIRAAKTPPKAETISMTIETKRIIQAVKAVPPGKVSSYRDIALAAGLPHGARQVVRILHSMSESQHLPWHRIIKADGNIALREGAGRELQIALLRAEGVEVTDAGHVSFRGKG
ncbi:MAG: MGMT family protein [Treponema sp.]|jgi:methylated-DNA-protein-cysteine methyltransferase-like protein|nr:MGMT family protein [Treponema sp.]